MPKILITEISQGPDKPVSGKQRWFADSATKLPAVIDNTGKKTILGLTDIAESEILYVGKHGNDTNTGVNNGRAFLTPEVAVAKAITQNPASNKPFSIKINDAGVYILTGQLEIPSWVKIEAPSATIIGNILLNDDSDFHVHVHKGAATAGGAVCKTSGSGVALYNVDEFILADNGTYDFMCCSSGQLVSTVSSIISGETATGKYFVNSGTSSIIKAQINHADYDNGNIFLENTGGTYSEIECFINCVHAFAAGIGVNCTGGAIRITANHFAFLTLGNVASPGELYLNVSKISGTDFTGDGKIIGLHASKWAFQRATYDTIYGKRAAKAIASNGSDNFTFFIPPDAVEILNIYLIGIITSGAAGIDKDIDLSSDYSKMGSDELKDHHSEIDTTTLYDLSGKAEKTVNIEISAVFSEVAANDSCGLLVDHQSIGGTIYYLGVGVEYTT